MDTQNRKKLHDLLNREGLASVLMEFSEWEAIEEAAEEQKREDKPLHCPGCDGDHL